MTATHIPVSPSMALLPRKKGRIAAIRDRFQRMRPSLDELIERREVSAPVDAEFEWPVRRLIAQLKAIREEHGIKQSELAARIGMDPTALNRIESGRQANLTFQTLGKIAKGLGCEVALQIDRISSDDPERALSSFKKYRAASEGSRLLCRDLIAHVYSRFGVWPHETRDGYLIFAPNFLLIKTIGARQDKLVIDVLGQRSDYADLIHASMFRQPRCGYSRIELSRAEELASAKAAIERSWAFASAR